MALRWLLHTACYVTSNPNETLITHSNEQPNMDHHHHVKTNSKTSVVANVNGALTASNNNNNINMEWCPSGFQMPVHYPRYTKADYEKMEEWKVDRLLTEYGLNCNGNVQEKRLFAMGAFLWPDQY
ncbi:hypothetical protein ACFE04_001827 [Oxalis oulophora]